MKPRSYWGSLLQYGVIVFPLSIFVWSLLSSMGPKTLGEAFATGGWWMGLIFGAAMTPAVAFMLRRRTMTVPVHDKDAFIPEITKTLAATGYRLGSQAGNVLTFTPSARAGIFAPEVTVEVEETSATIVGPSTQLRKLQKRL